MQQHATLTSCLPQFLLCFLGAVIKRTREVYPKRFYHCVLAAMIFRRHDRKKCEAIVITVRQFPIFAEELALRKVSCF